MLALPSADTADSPGPPSGSRHSLPQDYSQGRRGSRTESTHFLHSPGAGEGGARGVVGRLSQGAAPSTGAL